MNLKLRTRSAALVLLVLCMSVLGCDGANDPGEVRAEAIEEMSTMMTSVFTVLGQALTQIQVGAAKREPAADTYPCTRNGSYDVDGSSTETDTGFRFDASVAFRDCDGISGSLSYSGSGLFTTERFEYDVGFDGALEGACRLSYDDVRQRFASDFSGASSTMAISGRIDVQCGGERFSCRFDGTTVNLNGNSTDVYDGACR